MYMLLDVYMQNLAIPNIIGKQMFNTYEEAKNEAINQAEAEFQNYYQKMYAGTGYEPEITEMDDSVYISAPKESEWWTIVEV